MNTYPRLIALSFENTSDDCFMQQGAGGGFGAVLKGGTVIKATKSSLKSGTKSQMRQKAESALNPFGGNTYAAGSPGAARRAAAKAKLAQAAAGTAGTTVFQAGAGGVRTAGSTRRLNPAAAAAARRMAGTETNRPAVTTRPGQAAPAKKKGGRPKGSKNKPAKKTA